MCQIREVHHVATTLAFDSLKIANNGTMKRINSFELKHAELAVDYRIATWVASAPEVLTFAGRSLSYPFTAEQFFASAADRWETYVLQVGRDAVATGALEDRCQSEMRIGRVLDAPAQRGNGVGRVMMEHLIDTAASRPGTQCITLSVFEKNSAACALYESFGFVDTDDRVAVKVHDPSRCFMRLSRSVLPQGR